MRKVKMAEIIDVVYEKGVLRPLKPLSLREKQQLRVRILPDSDNSLVDQAFMELASEGVITLPTSLPDDEPPMTNSELRLLAREISAAAERPLSEIIIEERGEW
jgi:predicted DNA-binding antitoxin AbrB/MazE fold protein